VIALARRLVRLSVPAISLSANPSKGHAYNVQIVTTTGKEANVRKSYTRGLAVHPVGESSANTSSIIVLSRKIAATAVTFVALLLSFSSHITVTLVASLVSFLAALLTLIAFAIDIALYVLVRHQMNNLNINANTNTAPGSS